MSELVPVPRSCIRADPPGRSDAVLSELVDPAVPDQGYRLSVTRDAAVLRYADDAGRRYGLGTVAQLRDDDGRLPLVEIEDHPDFAVRGVMLDVSRDRVPTRATLERLVELMVSVRYNHLQLYIEHTFAFVDHEPVWRSASPLDADDLRWLDSLCERNGIELAANQNTFGHMGRWLELDEYRDRAECPGGTDLIPGLHWPAGVLEPTQSNAEFALSLVREQMAALNSTTVNIGCDETFELGRGASAERVAAEGLGAVYGEHLSRLISPLLDEGCSVLVWADVLEHHPAALDLLPEGDVTALVWNYEAPDAPAPDVPEGIAEILDEIGIDMTGPTDFATRVAPFERQGIEHWVVPGTSGWNSLIGRLDNGVANLLDAAVAGIGSGATGYLVTEWGDGGHHHPPAVTDAPFLYGGVVSWCAATNAELAPAELVNRFVVDPTGIVGDVIVRIGSLHRSVGLVARNSSPINSALFPHLPDLASGDVDVDGVRAVIAALDAAESDLREAGPSATDGAVVVDELIVAIGLARHGARRLLVRAGVPSDDAALRAELAGLIDEHRRVWLLRSRPGGLDDSVAHLERTLDTYS